MINRNSVIIKSNAYGLILILDPDMPFSELLQDVGDKFRNAARFFKNARMALTFRGRVLTREQERQMVYAITSVTRTLEADEENDGQFYRGTLLNGQVLEMEKSVIVLGDVNPGAQIISKGNIVVLGCCMGSVYAGAAGNNRCFAAALIMKPRQVRIADKTARSAITKKTDTGEYEIDPKIVYIKDEHLKMEPLSGSSFSDLINTSPDEGTEG